MKLFGRLRDAARSARGADASRRVAAELDSTLPAMPRRPSVQPILPVADLATAIDFYRGLGFDVSTYDDGHAWVNRCGWELFHVNVMPGVRPGVAAAYAHVDDPDGWRAALAALHDDAEIRPVADMPWGMREFSFTDPSGNVIRMGRNL